MRAVFFALLLQSACGLYTVDDDVVDLGVDNFSLVTDSKDLWFVEFYAPWCGHCKSLVPEWKKLATALAGIANVGAVDMTVHKAVGEPYDVTGFPTIKVFSTDKSTPLDYEGARTATALASFAIKEVKDIVKARLGIKKSGKKPKKAKAASDVVDATAASFQKDVMENEDLVLVEFFAPWCGHCKTLAPEWKKAATQLKGKGVTLVAVDATVHSELGKKYGVTGYPTIKVFAQGDKSADPTDYSGGRTASAITEWALGQVGAENAEGAEGEAGAEEEASAVVVLTDNTFAEKVDNSSDLWIVEFFAPWCGHCKTLAPHWKKAADQLEGQVKFGTVDCTVEQKLGEKYEVKSFPTIKVFGADKAEPELYEGGRITDSIVSAALSYLSDMNAKPREVLQITTPTVFEEECAGNMCLLAFLPHILDTGAAGREVYLDILREQALRYKKQNIGFLWAEATLQGELEKLLDVGGGGYPALNAVNAKKGLNIPFFGGFEADGVAGFMKRVMAGKEAPMKFKGSPVVVASEAWDGKDGEMPKEEL